MTPRFDRTRPESPAAQALIQQRAATKRARKAAKRRRDAELTVLGRRVSREVAFAMTHDCGGDALIRAHRALEARRAAQ